MKRAEQVLVQTDNTKTIQNILLTNFSLEKELKFIQGCFYLDCLTKKMKFVLGRMENIVEEG